MSMKSKVRSVQHGVRPTLDMPPPSRFAAFREICISHELSERDVVQQDEPIVSIEMFLFNLPKVSADKGAILMLQLICGTEQPGSF